MISPIFWITAILAAFCIAVAGLLLFPPPRRSTSAGDGLSVVSGESVVTVRRIGVHTSVTIRGVADHWDESRGVALPPTPIEVTRAEEPELYAEYMSPDTSATRKYEIADHLYSMGYSLPLIPGLIEQWKREQEELRVLRERDAEATRAALEPTPPAYRNLDIDESLRHEPLDDLAPPEAPLGDSPEEIDIDER